jgi:hypothetical protein
VDDKPVTDSAVTSNSQQQTAQPSRGRAAKAQANLRLDAQAKALAAFRSEETAAAASSAKHGKPPPASSTPRPLGTRLSARLRGDGADGEWQPIPEEWLGLSTPDDKAAATPPPPAGKGAHKTGLESDLESTSDLTELSDSSEEEGREDAQKEDDEEEDVTDEKSSRTDIEPPVVKDPKPTTASKEEETEIKMVHDRDLDDIPIPPDGFIEWETVSLQLFAFNSFHNLWTGRYVLLLLNGSTLRSDSRNRCITVKRRCIRFSKRLSCLSSRKNLGYVTLISPRYTLPNAALIKEAERKRRLEDAVVHRKRSSRIAIRESEKEEARLVARRKAEEDEKLARARRLQARQEKEEADRAKREMAREQRKKEREAKERQKRFVLDVRLTSQRFDSF